MALSPAKLHMEDEKPKELKLKILSWWERDSYQKNYCLN